ncbi:hypothetical protein D3C87_918400 [compost metagenome]
MPPIVQIIISTMVEFLGVTFVVVFTRSRTLEQRPLWGGCSLSSEPKEFSVCQSDMLRQAAGFGQEQPLKIEYEKHMEQQAATTLLMFLTPFVAWAFHGLGGMLNKHLGRNAVNGASVYNWLSVAIAALPALANDPKTFGRILAAFAISWIVGVSLSKKHKRSHLANAVKTTDA